MDKGLLYVVSGPSGAGKGTVMACFRASNPEVFYSISATTRKPRPGEEDGVQYYFLEKDEFLKLRDADGFLEHASFCGNYYGTPKSVVLDKLSKGIDVILEIEVQGALQVMKSYPEAVSVFIAPPSMEELRRRLVGRNTEPMEIVEQRLETAKKELLKADVYSYIVVNDTPENAADTLSAIMAAEKARSNRKIEFVKEKLL